MGANPKLSGLLDSIIKAGSSLAPQVLQMFGGGNSSAAGGQAKGLAAISAFCNQVIAGLNQILASAPNIPQTDAISGANQLVATLSNSSLVYQAKNGKDGAALAKAKTDAAAIVAQIAAKYTAVAPVTVTDVTGGQLVTSTQTATVTGAGVASGEFVAGVPNIVLIGGAGVVLLLLLKK
jgi:predicted extracellular nuclease